MLEKRTIENLPSICIQFSKQELALLNQACQQSGYSQVEMVRDCVRRQLHPLKLACPAELQEQWLQELTNLRREIVALKQENTSLFSALNSVGIWRTDPLGKCTFANEKALEINDLTADEILMAGWAKTLHPDDRQPMIEAWNSFVEEVQQGHQPIFRIECRTLFPDGSIKWKLAEARPEQNPDGGLIGFIGTVLDITERKAAEEALRQSEAKLRLILENAPSIVLLVEPDGTINFINQVLPGFSHDRVLGASIYEFTAPDSRLSLESAFQQVFQIGEPACLELRGMGSDGQIRDYETRIAPIAITGTISLAAIVATDITIRKQEQEALQHREAHHRAILDAIPDLMLRVQQDGTCVECIQPQGDRAGTFLPITHHINEVLSPHLLQQELHMLEQTLITGSVQVFEHPIEKYGRTYYEEVRTSLISQDELLVIVRDITAQKQAEADRDRLFNLSLDLICVAGFDGFFQQLNPAWEKTLGYSRKELIAVPYLDFVHPEDRDRTIAEAAKFDQGQDTLFFHNRYRCRDGSYRWLSWNARSVPEERLIYCVARDITEQKQINLALHQSEERYRSLVSNLPGVVYRCHNDADWTMEFLSDAIQDLCGYPAIDFIHNQLRTYTSIIYPDDRDRVNTVIQSAIGQRKPFELEYRIQHFNGSQRWVYERGQGVLNADGMLNYLDGVIFDITDRKHTEAALALAEANYRSIFENALEGIFQSTRDGRYLRVNSAMARIHGYESAEQMMALVQEIGHQIYVNPACREQFVHLMEMNGEVKGLQYQVYRKDGQPIWVEENTRSVHDADGNLLYYEGFVEDISDRKREEEELRSQLQALRIEIDQQKRQRDVTQVMQTDYFQQLQADVEQLRYQDPS